MTAGEKIGQLIESKSSSVKQWAEENGISYNSLNAVIKNRRPLGMEFFLKLKEVLPEMDANHILFDGEINNVDYLPKKMNEPTPQYEVSDPFEKTFLTYLEKPKSQAIMEKHIKNIIAQLDLGSGTPHTISHGEENSPLMQRIEDELKKDKE